MLFNVRYEIATSEMMENNMDVIVLNIRKEFSKYDHNDTGVISI